MEYFQIVYGTSLTNSLNVDILVSTISGKLFLILRVTIVLFRIMCGDLSLSLGLLTYLFLNTLIA
jgi:hypothetical protein